MASKMSMFATATYLRDAGERVMWLCLHGASTTVCVARVYVAMFTGALCKVYVYIYTKPPCLHGTL